MSDIENKLITCSICLEDEILIIMNYVRQIIIIFFVKNV